MMIKEHAQSTLRKECLEEQGPFCPAGGTGTSPKVQWVLEWALESDTQLGMQVLGLTVLLFPQ